MKSNKNYKELYGFIWASKKMDNVYKEIKYAAKCDFNVLIYGETGTGKEILSKLIHLLSRRKNYPFIAINCAAIPGEMFELELFGCEKGAFTGAFERRIGKLELANNGTILLDEISAIPINLQSKLLRVSDPKTRSFYRLGGLKKISPDIRLITTINENPKNLIEEGSFRKDLLYRLNTIQINVPPLRERPEDIPVLAEYFITLLNNKYNYDKQFSPEIIDLFINYEWPGNVRELENIIKRAWTMYEKIISPEAINNYFKHLEDEKSENEIKLNRLILTGTNYKKMEQEFRREWMKRALEITGGNQTRASELVGMTPFLFNRWLHRLNINPTIFKT